MRRLVLVTAAALALLVGGAPPASATVAQVDGVQTPVTDVTAMMSGDLVGTWTLTSFDSLVEHPAGNVKGSGTEHFDGCLDVDRSGTCGSAADVIGWLDFTFTYSNAVSGNGRCHHPVVDAGGELTGTTGQLTMKDRIGSCGELHTTYSGHLAIPG